MPERMPSTPVQKKQQSRLTSTINRINFKN